MRQRGSGGLIRLKKKDGSFASPYWYLAYWANGRQIRESSKTASKMVAEALLRKRLSERDAGQKPAVDIGKVTYENLRYALLQDYQINGRKSLVRRPDGSSYLPPVLTLDKFFAGWKANAITADAIRRFVLAQQQAGAANGTINRTLAALSRMFRLAIRDGKLQSAPHIELLKEAAPRKGFLELPEFRRLRQELPERLRVLATLAFYTGMRLGELRKLKWESVNLADGTLRLNPGETKNDEARLIPLTGEVLEMLRFQRQKNPQTERVFEVGWFTKSWRTACVRAGLGKFIPREGTEPLYNGLIFHDLRRAGIRNLLRAGISEQIAMRISGHRTTTVFRRYNIINEADLRAAAKKLEHYLSDSEVPSDTTTVKKDSQLVQ